MKQTLIVLVVLIILGVIGFFAYPLIKKTDPEIINTSSLESSDMEPTSPPAFPE